MEDSSLIGETQEAGGVAELMGTRDARRVNGEEALREGGGTGGNFATRRLFVILRRDFALRHLTILASLFVSHFLGKSLVLAT